MSPALLHCVTHHAPPQTRLRPPAYGLAVDDHATAAPAASLGTAAQPARPAGWGSNADLMLPLAPPLHAAGLALLFIDTRCHGASDDDTFASLPRFAEDTVHAVDWLAARSDIDSSRIALLGHSVGAGAVLLAASWRERITAVVSLAAFAHPAEMMQRWMIEQDLPDAVIGPYILRYVQHTIGYRFDVIAPVSTLPQLRCPVLLMHGEDDTVVPVADAHRLLAAADSGKVQLHIGPGGHDSMEAFLTVIGQVSGFLTEHCIQSAPRTSTDPAHLSISGRPQ
ncbi:MAG: dipeptidyl aminopeptidase [Thiomonas sp. 20-64-5]|nr:MAG: dipeptidyl aminopeptidase [Thiomonas sp. 20-64-5]